jgi:gliding motility-associated-like protein
MLNKRQIQINLLPGAKILKVVLASLCMAFSHFGFGQYSELCKNAIPICSNQLNGFQGRLKDTNQLKVIWPEYIFPNSGVCDLQGNFDNTTWYSFTVCDSILRLRITYSNCQHPEGNLADTGIQSGLYRNCRYTSSLDCASLNGSKEGNFTLEYDDFEPGDVALLVLDGYAGSICDFKIEVIRGVNSTSVPSPDTTTMKKGTITGPNVINCSQLGQAQRYSLAKPECEILYAPNCVPNENIKENGLDSIKWLWSVSPSEGRQFVNNDSLGLFNDIIFTQKGNYTISARPIFHKDYGGTCKNGGCGEINSWNVEVLEADTIKEAPIVRCPDEVFVYCGNTILRDTLIYCQGLNCLVTEQPIVFRNYLDSDIGEQIVCAGQRFNFQGTEYSEGNYTVKDKLDCSKRYTFVVKSEKIDLNLTKSDSILNCKVRDLQLQSQATTALSSPISYRWLDVNQNIISNLSNVYVQSPGTYTLEVYASIGNNKLCSSKATLDIKQDVEKPIVTANIPQVRCNQQSSVLTLVPNRQLVSNVWKTPTGSSIQNLNVAVDSLNAVTGLPYLFSGVAENGCTIDTSFLIPVNFEKPILTVDGDMLTCYKPSSVLSLTSNVPVDSVKWFFTDSNNATVFTCCDNAYFTSPQDVKGLYTARARSIASHCYNTGSKFLEEDKVSPLAKLAKDTLWRCNTTSIPVLPVNVSTGGEFSYRWFTSDGVLQGDINSTNITASRPGAYVFSVFNKNNGCIKKDTINITQDLNIPKDIKVQWTDISCFGKNDGILTIQGHEEGGQLPFQYTINGINYAVGTSKNNLGPGDYKVIVSDKYSCKDSAVVSLVEPQELTVASDPIIELSLFENTTLDFTSSYDISDLKSIKWFNNKGEILGTQATLDYTGADDDLLTLEIVNQNGCTSRAEIEILVDQDLKIFIPNTFSPNGDGVNDVFAVFKNNIPATLNGLSVYDRFGNQVFVSNNLDWNDTSAGWDGTFRGQRVESGVYIVTLSYIDYKTNIKTHTSSLLITH